jgi:hypothetical protein
MTQLSLVNRSGKAIKIGDYVKFHPTYHDAFIYTEIGDANIIGTASQNSYPGTRCLINLLNTVNYDDLIDKPTTSEIQNTLGVVPESLIIAYAVVL